MAEFRVTPDSLRSAASNLAKAQAEVAAQLQGVKGQVTQVSSVWTGDAASRFDALMTKWDTSARALNETLGTIHQNLTASAANYEAAEVEAAKGFSV